MGAGRGACGDTHGWDPGHLALAREAAKRASVTARNCASPRRCQRLGTGWLEGRAPGTAPPPPPWHTPMRYHPTWALSTGQIKDSSFPLGRRAWGRTPNTSLGSALVPRTASNPSTSSLCITAAHAGGCHGAYISWGVLDILPGQDSRMVFVSRQAWTGRCDSWAFLGLCFPLLLALRCMCMVGCNEERELLLMGTGVGRVWKRISFPNSCQNWMLCQPPGG